jgi:hypothetical protein
MTRARVNRYQFSLAERSGAGAGQVGFGGAGATWNERSGADRGLVLT